MNTMNASKRVAVIARGTGTDLTEMVITRDEREIATGVTFDAAIARWLELAQAMMDKHAVAVSRPPTPQRMPFPAAKGTAATTNGLVFGTKLTLDAGRRYVRVWSCETLNGTMRTADGREHAYAFIDMLTGNVHKPDGYKKPAKHARGNIWDENPIEWCGPYGVSSIR